MEKVTKRCTQLIGFSSADRYRKTCMRMSKRVGTHSGLEINYGWTDRLQHGGGRCCPRKGTNKFRQTGNNKSTQFLAAHFWPIETLQLPCVCVFFCEVGDSHRNFPIGFPEGATKANYRLIIVCVDGPLSFVDSLFQSFIGSLI